MKIIKRILLLLFAFGFIVSLSSCFILSGLDDMGTLIVENQSEETIFFMYISNANSMNWGDDVLGDDVINPGDKYRLPVPSGYYDVQIANFFNIELDSIYDQLVLPGESTTITYY
ncbi:MAG: hypothetical protein H8D65_01470 [Spirochaetes bacterium]|nr:hypothetical protein [Spirochaetota bacterium]MBL7005600.1 hypothetical protein [Spirochaetia bacterium]